MRLIFKIIYQKRELLFLGLILWFAYYVRIWGIKLGLPYPWHFDEPHVIHSALRILKTGDYNPHDFTYPGLVIYLQTINAVLCYLSILTDPLVKSVLNLKEILTNADTGWYFTISHPVFYEWGRRLTVIFGTLSVGLVYVICSRYYASLLAAILSSLFLACSLGHINLSIWTTVDVPTAFFILATAFSSILLMLKGERKLYIISGLLVGLCIACKYNSWPAVILPVTAHILNKNKSSFFSPETLIIFAAVPAGFLIGSPYSIIDLSGFLNSIAYTVWYYTHVPGWNVYSPNPAIAWGGIPTEEYTKLSQLLFYYRGFCEDRWAFGGGGGVGTYIFYAAALGVFSGFFINWRVHLLLLSYPLAFVWYMSGMQGNFMRNMTAVNAFLCLFAGLFICQVLNLISSLLKKMRVPATGRAICVTLAGILFLIYPLYKAINCSLENYHNKDTRVLAVEWLKQNVSKPQKTAFVSELRWFKPDIDKLGLEYILFGQLEKESVWFWNEGFDYVVIGRNYEHNAQDPNILLSKYERSFSNTTIVQSLGKGSITLQGMLVNPMLQILKVDASFCESKYWNTNSDFFEFKLDEFKNNSHRKKLHWADKTSWELKGSGAFCSPKVVFEEGSYEVEITAYGAPAAGVLPVMKLESLQWKDGKQGQHATMNEWPVEGIRTFKGSIFKCQKGDVMSFNVIFSNDDNKQEKESAQKLNIQQIIVRKKG